MTPPPARTMARRRGGWLQPRRASQPRSPPGGLTEARGAGPRRTGGDRPSASAGGSCPREAGRALLEERPHALRMILGGDGLGPVSYTHLRAHETGRNLVCRLLLEK